MSNSEKTGFLGLGVVALSLTMGLQAPAAWGQTATDLVCGGCVQATDIANGTIGPNKLIPGSINATTIANQSIGPNKLIPGSINTSVIAADAIRGNKVLNGSLTGNDIADSSLTSADIANGTITAADIANNAILSNKILDGAVTSAKLAAGAVGEAALAEDAVFRRILIIRNDPLDQTGNCDELLGVLADITDNDANNRYLVLLEPGIYDCEATSVQMKPFVDIQGSGRESTLITGTKTGTNGGGVVRNAGNAELRNLSVRNTNGNVAVNIEQAGARVTDVRAEITGTAGVAYAFLILNFSGNAVVTNVEAKAGAATAFSSGFFVAGGNVNAILADVVATAGAASSNSSGVQLAASATVTVRHSALSGDDGGVIVLASSSGTANLVSSQLDGLVAAGGPGTFRCVGAYDGSFSPLNSSCN